MNYTGRAGEQQFEQDFIAQLQSAGWGEVLPHPSQKDLAENLRNIVFFRNREELNSVPLSDTEMKELMEVIQTASRSPVQANLFLQNCGNHRNITIKRDKDSPDVLHAGKEVYLNLFAANEIAGGSSVYQIAEQPILPSSKGFADNRGDITLLINGLPVIHIELKASGHDLSEACFQLQKYTKEGCFTGLMGLIQIFWAITPEDAIYFANPGDSSRFNPSFYFCWSDPDNHSIWDWKQLITGKSHILSIPESHQMIAYYTTADTAKDVLRVCRPYQYEAIHSVVKRTSQQRWGDHDQKGGFVWNTTGSGKSLSIFKSGQMIIDLNFADKVVFLVDRQSLDEQAAGDYESFMRDGEHIVTTQSTKQLIRKLKSNHGDDTMIITSIQKLQHVGEDADRKEADSIANKRIVFIVDEAHRSQFGKMHVKAKEFFYNSLFFGFTGTPIFSENKKYNEFTTEAVFGSCLAVYSLASGIKDGNVLGFAPSMVRTFDYTDVKEQLALKAAGTADKNRMTPVQKEKYLKFLNSVRDQAEYDEDGNVKIKGIEDYLSDKDYDNDSHRKAVVEDIIKHAHIYMHDHLFHGILATETIQEACAYWQLFQEYPGLHVTALFDMSTDQNTQSVLNKEEYIGKILANYNQMFNTAFTMKTDPKLSGYKKDVMLRLAHKVPYQHVSPDSVLDIVIVVNQLLTGYDSQFVNIIYLDKTPQSDNLIQTISRTNRVYQQDLKPFGVVRFYRKPETMKHNLEEALKLYCQGDETDVIVHTIEENIEEMNQCYEQIEQIFDRNKIQNFECLPKAKEDRMQFRRLFRQMNKLVTASKLQGFPRKEQNDLAKLHFSNEQFHILSLRYQDSAVSQPDHQRSDTLPNDYLVDPSSRDMERITGEYLEKRFHIATKSDITKSQQKQNFDEIRQNLGILPIQQQVYAREMLKAIESGGFQPEGMTLNECISIYREQYIQNCLKEEAENYSLDEELLYQYYMNSIGKPDVDGFLLAEVKKTADRAKLAKQWNCGQLSVMGKLQKELETYAKERKAELQND